MNDIVIRSARDEDSEHLIRLIGAIFAEYPGCIFDVGEMPELRQPASAAHADEGRWWVAELDGEIVGSVAVVPEEADGIIELKKLYVSQEARRRGLGAHLVGLAESEARERGATAIVLWTDTRFEDAHKLYSRLGFLRAPRTRVLNDLSNTVEFHYTKDLGS